MSDRLLVATRKGLFDLARSNGAWRVERVSFLGDPVTMVLPDQRDGNLYAGLNLGHFGPKLRRSTDEGATWDEIARPAFEEGHEGASVSQVWALEAGGPGELWAGTIPGALFRSADCGSSWSLARGLWDRPERAEWFGGGYDQPGIHSICVDPRDPGVVSVGVSCGGMWTTTDGGLTWELRADGMRADYMPPDRANDPGIQDPHRVVACPASPDHLWAQHHNGIFGTADGGRRWEEVRPERAPAFGFAVAVHPSDPRTAWFVPARKDECRVPLDGRLVVTRTRDGGRSFDVLARGLPQEHAYDLVYRHALDVDRTGDRLAFGSTTGGLWTSDDGGDGWALVSARLPPVYAVRFA